MANTTDERTHNQPSHEASVKGGQDSHSGNSNKDNHNKPSHEAQVKGGDHSHSGSK
jgi:hypothetical protein